jgi:hypothetical protein
MVCYARRTAWIAILGIILLVMLGANETHLFDVVGLLVTLAIVLGGAVTGAGLTVLALRSVQHRRAAAGACLTCRFQCQHALPPPAQRLWLISTVDRGAPGQQVFMPTPQVPVRGHSGPQWPDRPLITTGRSDS